MSVGQKLKIKTAQNDALQAEVALMRAEHRLKMATENAEILDLRAEMQRITQTALEIAKERDKAEAAWVVLKAEYTTARADSERLAGELAEEMESSCRQGCCTRKVEADCNGQVAGSMVTDSGALSTYADQLRRLAELGRFRIVADRGRMVVGYWPENDPAARTQEGST